MNLKCLNSRISQHHKLGIPNNRTPHIREPRSAIILFCQYCLFKRSVTIGVDKPPLFADRVIELLSVEAIKLLGYEAIRRYGHIMPVNTDLILNLVSTPFTAEPIYTFRKFVLFLGGMGNARSHRDAIDSY